MRYVPAVMGVLLLVAVNGFCKEPPFDPTKIRWETNVSDSPFSSPSAKRGGILKTYVLSYPQTFRLYGPNSNDAFAHFTRKNCLDFSVVGLHPNTRNYIPILATHWKVMPDNRTLYFKLDPDARWSDGKPITADDYVFGYQMMLSPHIKDPFYNKYFGERFETVEKIDDYTLKVVGKKPSWRALFEYNVAPVAKHAVRLGENWVKEANWEKPVCAGPYVVDQTRVGKMVTFKRVANWWGDKKKYLQNLYNYDALEIRVILDIRTAFDYFKKDMLTLYQVSQASLWANETNFDEVKKGWVMKKRVFTEAPQGFYGLIINLNTPIFQSKDFRKALQHLFDFEKINEKLMFGAYVRLVSAFYGTEYANTKLKPYAYDPQKARELLKKAGYKKRGSDGILVDDKGNRCSFTIVLSSSSIEKHLSVYVEDLKAEGVEAKLKVLDGATAFRYLLQRNFQMATVSMTADIYPDPWEYFHSSFKSVVNNNNFFAFGTPETDRLIETYQRNMSKDERIKAMAELDRIIQDEAIYIPFWGAPYVRFLGWKRVGMPETIATKLTSQVEDLDTFWIDPEKDQILKKAMAEGKSLPVDPNIDFDPFHLMKK